MAAEGDERAVVRVGSPARVGIVHEAVVEVCGIFRGVNIVGFLGGDHFPEIPEFHGLVFRIGEDVAAVAFAVDVGETFCVAHEDAGSAFVGHAAPNPDLDKGVVGAGVEDMWGGAVAEADGIDVLGMAWDAEDGALKFDVVDVDGVVCRSSYDLGAVAREANGPDLVMSVELRT